MSQWTHILGVIRYDSMASNCYPIPWNHNDIIAMEMDTVSRSYQAGLVPYGSEGPLEVDFKLTKRGPTVIITGDLRDFGVENLGNIVEWISESNRRILANPDMIKSMLVLRDVFVNCNVEYNENLYVIEEVDEKIVLNIYMKKGDQNGV
jgi:hypothetical protein